PPRLSAADFGDVTHARRGVAGEGLPAPTLAAGALRAIRIERHVSELTGGVRLATEHLAADHDADADAVGHTHVGKVVHGARVAGERPETRHRAGDGCAFDEHRNVDELGERVAKI